MTLIMAMMATIALGYLPDAIAKVPSRCQEHLAEPPLLKTDIEILRLKAQQRQLVLIVMAPNPASLSYSQQRGFAAKTKELMPCKSGTEGLVQCPPSLFKDARQWREVTEDLSLKGYEVLGPEKDFLVRRISDGKYFYSDYDLLGVYDPKTRRSAYTEELRQELNTEFGRRLVRHGPLSDFADRHKIAIKYPAIAFLPSGEMVQAHDEESARAIYRQLSIPWPFDYSGLHI